MFSYIGHVDFFEFLDIENKVYTANSFLNKLFQNAKELSQLFKTSPEARNI